MGSTDDGDAPADHDATTASLTAPIGRRHSQLRIRGRDALIRRLYDVVIGGARPRVHLLHGLSGSGKTAVALEVAALAQADNVTVWWVQADDARTLQEHMRMLSREVDAATDPQAGHPARHLWRALEAQQRRWLLVIDNADRLETLAAGTGRLDDGRGWVHHYQGTLGTVLVLSRRNLDFPIDWWRSHPVGMLDEVTSIDVLADHIEIKEEDRPAAAELAKRLGHLPLALRLAGAYLQDSRDQARQYNDPPVTIREYLAAIDTDGLALEQPPSSPAARRFVDRPWSMSIDLLERRDPYAVELLRTMSYLANAPIPLGDLREWPGLDPERPREQLSESLQSLMSLALAEAQPDPATGTQIVLHPLVRDATRRRFPPTLDHTVALVHLVRNCRTLRGQRDAGPVPEDSQRWPSWQVLTPHVLHMVRALLDAMPGQSEELAPVVRDACYAGNFAARSMQGRGLYAAADVELAGVERLALRHLGPHDPETLRCRHIRAVVLHARGLITEAYEAYDAVYRLRQRILGPDDRETVRSRHYRALALHDLGRYDEALAEYEAVLDARLQLSKPLHRNTLSTRHNIARVLHDTGYRLGDTARLREAERQYRELLEDQRREMGPDYRHTLATRHNLAVCLHAQGHHDEAQAEYDDVVDIECRLLGPLHPDTLATRANRAMLLAERGHPGAEAELREVYEAQYQVLGPNHPETVATAERRVHHRTRSGPL